MKKLLFYFLFSSCSLCFCQENGIRKISELKATYFRIDQIYPGIMSNPNSLFTNFIIPDSLKIKTLIKDKNDSIIYSFQDYFLSPGKYQIYWNYEKYKILNSGTYILKFIAINNKEEVIYNCNIRFILLK
jgi:hypothetical protein